MALRAPGAWCVLAVLAGGCTVDPTQVVVVVSSDLPAPERLDGFAVRITSEEGGVVRKNESYALDGGDAVEWPATFGVAPLGGDANRRVRVEVDGTHDGAMVVTTTAITSFVEHERLRLDMFLAARCVGKPCGPDQTCRKGECVSEEIDPTDLPVWRPGERIDVPDAAVMDSGAADSGLDVAGCVTLDTITPVGLGDPYRLVVAGGLAYVANCTCIGSFEAGGLWIADVANPADLGQGTWVETFPAPSDLGLVGDLVLYATSEASIAVADTSPIVVFQQPLVLDDPEARSYAVATSGTRAFVAAGSTALAIVDLTGPPVLQGQLPTAGFALDVAASGDYVFVADSQDLLVVSVADPDNPTIVRTVDRPGLHSVEVAATTLVAGNDTDLTLEVFDVTDPTDPRSQHVVDIGRTPIEAAVHGSIALVTGSEPGLQVVDLTRGILFPERIPTPGPPYAVTIGQDGEIAYVTDGTSLSTISLACVLP